MSLLKAIGKFLSKYQDVDRIQMNQKPTNLIATTTIINKKRISRVIHSYSGLSHPIIKIHKNSYRRKNARILPIAESSAISSKSICFKCTEKKKKARKFCKCCGNELNKKVAFNDPKDSNKCFVMLEGSERLYRQRNAKSKPIEKFKHVAVRDEKNKIVKTCLKKSKAMTNIKKIEYNSFLSNKRKYSSTLSSTMQENIEINHKINKIKRKRECEVENLEQKISSTFVVDFASTPIKLAPKTSTPVKFKN